MEPLTPQEAVALIDPSFPEDRSTPFSMDGATFRRLGHALVDRLARHFDEVGEGPVTPGEYPEVVRSALGAQAGLPEQGTDAEVILTEATDLLLDHSLFNGHPRFLGYITASPAPLGVLAELLASAVNPNVGAWALSPMASEIEAQAVRWMGELIGMPEGSGGLLVSGGNMANTVGFWAARAAAGERWRIRETGVCGGASRLRVYASAETHTWLQKASDLSGMGTESVRWIATDTEQRMDLDALRDAISNDRQAGDEPMMVVGTAGSVSTGAVDPLGDIAAICRAEKVWFHVDGAYGGFAAASPAAPDTLRELALADSVAVDPHKWLYAPLEAGCLLTRDPARLRAAFAYHPPYYHFGSEVTNYVDLGPQNSRGFRALKVWMQLRQAGRAGYAKMISEDIALARRLDERVQEHPELEGGPGGLSISTFRYVPPELASGVGTPEVEAQLEALNREIQARMERGGAAFVSNAVVGPRYLLRACIVNFNTAAADIDAIPPLTEALGREVWLSRPAE